MTPQPLPPNLHPSQCFRLLDPERDTLQDGDQVLSVDQKRWHDIWESAYGQKPAPSQTYRRPFTPPAPVQVQEFWRLLEVGETMLEGDGFFNAMGEWKDLHVIHRGNKFTQDCRPVRRRVTVPVAAPAPAPVADAGPVESLKSLVDLKASMIVKAFWDAPKAEPSGDYAAYRERLFKYAEENFGHTLINSEMDEIELIVLGYFKHKAPVADAPKAEPSGDYAAYRKRLFNYLVQECHETPLESEIDGIQRIVLKYFQHKAHEPKAEPVTESGPYLVSVDGHEAPTMEHSTISEARAEAERLARQEHSAQVRLLRQVAVAKAEVTVKWSEQ